MVVVVNNRLLIWQTVGKRRPSKFFHGMPWSIRRGCLKFVGLGIVGKPKLFPSTPARILMKEITKKVLLNRKNGDQGWGRYFCDVTSGQPSMCFECGQLRWLSAAGKRSWIDKTLWKHHLTRTVHMQGSATRSEVKAWYRYESAAFCVWCFSWRRNRFHCPNLKSRCRVVGRSFFTALGTSLGNWYVVTEVLWSRKFLKSC